MVVNILVHIECCEDVERMTEIDFPWNNCVTSEDWEKVCGMDNGVDVDDGHNPIHQQSGHPLIRTCFCLSYLPQLVFLPRSAMSTLLTISK